VGFKFNAVADNMGLSSFV